MGEDRLSSLLLAWQEGQSQGRDVPAAELCRDCPALAEELGRRIGALRRMHALMQPGAAPAGPGVPAAALDAASGDRPTDLDDGETPRGPGPARPAPSGLAGPGPGYEVLEELGRGGMGVVFKARQISLNRLVALKVILAGAHAGPEAAARFEQEAATIARLKHPHVVQVYEYGRHAGTPYFSLELQEGGSLADKLQGQPQPPAQAARLVQTLARAVQAAHAQGVVHRDLKPANVLLAADGTPKVSDFGLAKQGDSGRTASGEVLGTPSYMAPSRPWASPGRWGRRRTPTPWGPSCTSC
jgi:hypothetical protein